VYIPESINTFNLIEDVLLYHMSWRT